VNNHQAKKVARTQRPNQTEIDENTKAHHYLKNAGNVGLGGGRRVNRWENLQEWVCWLSRRKRTSGTAASLRIGERAKTSPDMSREEYQKVGEKMVAFLQKKPSTEKREKKGGGKSFKRGYTEN